MPATPNCYDELRATVRAAKRSKPAGNSSDPPAVKTIRAALKKAHLSQVGVRLRAEKIDLTGIPMDELATPGSR